MNSSNNTKYKFDLKLMREVAIDKLSLEKDIDLMLPEIEAQPNPILKGQQLVKLGALERVIEDYVSSERHLREAIVLFTHEKNTKLLWFAQLRLAVTLQLQKKIKDAEVIYLNFAKMLESKEREEIKSLVDYFYFNWGLLKLHNLQHKTAVDYLVKALESRLAKGELESISQTQQILDVVREQIDKQALPN